jgi:hypothetical protein
MLHLIARYMAWKHATAFVLATEVWICPAGTSAGEEAVLAVGVEKDLPPKGVMRYISRTPRGPTWSAILPMTRRLAALQHIPASGQEPP